MNLSLPQSSIRFHIFHKFLMVVHQIGMFITAFIGNIQKLFLRLQLYVKVRSCPRSRPSIGLEVFYSKRSLSNIKDMDTI